MQGYEKYKAMAGTRAPIKFGETSQVRYLRSFDESTQETQGCVIKFKFIFIMAKRFPADAKPWIALMTGRGRFVI